MAKDQDLKVEPNPLEVHADTVNFNVSCLLPLKMLKKKKIYTVEVSYKYGDQTESIGTLEFKQTDFPNNRVEQPKIEESFSFPYTAAKEKGEVVIIGKASNEAKTKVKETEPLPVAKGIITTSKLVRDAYYVAYAPHGYNNQPEFYNTNVEFFFEKGSDRLRSSEVKSDRGNKLDAYIAAKNATKTVTIIGSHSPEGLESINSRLSENRAKVIREFYSKKMKQYDYKDLVDSIKFDEKVVFQDWSAFEKELAANTTLTADQKAQIKNTIASTSGSFFEKEKALQKLSFYKTLEKEVYPELRISKTQIVTLVPKKTDAEITILAKGIIEGKLSADTLKDDELMYAATLTSILDEKEKIYEAATKKSDSWESHNNLGAVYLSKYELESDKTKQSDLLKKAQTQFEIANNKKENPFSINNLAATYMLENLNEKALLTYIKASQIDGADSELKKGIFSGKGVMEIKFARYGEAIESLGYAEELVKGNKYNKGLAHLLKKDFSNAKSELANAIAEDSKDALAQYCTAITSARMGNEDLMAKHLKEAIKLDSSLRAKAQNDLEFLSFRDSDLFNAALK